MKFNIKKISELSGFSPATVSNTLNNKRNVSPETAEKILKIARENGYLSEKKIKRICVVTYRDSGEVFSESPFFSELLEGVENEGRRRGYATSIVNLYRHQSSYEEQLRTVLNDAGAGIILIGTELTEETIVPFYEASNPIVLVDCWLPEHPLNAVLMENIDSVSMAVDYLIKNGHKKIGYITSNTRIANFEERRRGFDYAMSTHGLTVKKEYIISARPSIDGAKAGVIQSIEAGNELPTAFFADNDMMALGAMNGFIEKGYKIPEDVSIIGFDDITLSKVIAPGLTTIHVQKKEMGRIAVKRLIEIIKHPSKAKTKIQLVNNFIIRGSVNKIHED